MYFILLRVDVVVGDGSLVRIRSDWGADCEIEADRHLNKPLIAELLVDFNMWEMEKMMHYEQKNEDIVFFY